MQSVSVDAQTGDLLITLPSASGVAPRVLTEHAPSAWQDVNGQQVSVSARYALTNGGGLPQVSFDLGAFDQRYPLTIDPTVAFIFTYGTTGSSDYARGAARDSAGNIYVTGSTYSADFGPLLPGSVRGDTNVFVTKFNADGVMQYNVVLGHTGTDEGLAIAVDADNRAYITGWTDSRNFPTTSNTFDRCYGAGRALVECTDTGTYKDAFAVRLSADGASLEYSTFVGGSNDDYGNGIAVDSNQQATIVGRTKSLDFPTQNAFDGDCGTDGACNVSSNYNGSDGFVFTLSADGSYFASNVSSTYFGGDGYEKINSVALDSLGHRYVIGVRSGGTTSPTGFWNTRPLPGQNVRHGNSDAFVARLDQSGPPVFSTYLGGSSDEDGNGIAVTADGTAIYVTGKTQSADFTSIAAALGADRQCGTDGNCNGTNDAFATKLLWTQGAPNLVYGYNTYLGGSGIETGNAIAIDSAGVAYVTGLTSGDFPIVDVTASPYYGGAYDAFAAQLDASNGGVVYSTYIGSAGYDEGYDVVISPDQSFYVVGHFNGGAPQGDIDQAFIAKLRPTIPVRVDLLDADNHPVWQMLRNANGWPSANVNFPNSLAESITVKITARNTSGSLLQAYLPITIASQDQKARFYVVDESLPSYCGFRSTVAFSYRQYQTECFFNIAANGTATIQFTMWVQPSERAFLRVSATLANAQVNGEIGHDLAAVQIPRAAVRPIVFLHGILGSMMPENAIITNNTQLKEKLDPFLGSYTPLMTNLQKMGLELGHSLFVLAYDWRQPNDVSAQYLANALIDNGGIRGVSRTVPYVESSNRVDLIAHSMGGLVSRAYIQGPNYPQPNGPVRNVVFIATPHKGFAFDYQTWEGALWNNYLYNAPGSSGGPIMANLMNTTVWPRLVSKRYRPTSSDLADCNLQGSNGGAVVITDPATGLVYSCKLDTVAKWQHAISASDSSDAANRGTRSLFEMLPTNDLQLRAGLTPGGYLVKPDNTLRAQEENTFLRDLNANIDTLEQRITKDHIFVIYGTDAQQQPTDAQYRISQVGADIGRPNMWRKGVVDPAQVNIDRGDDLILQSSTTLGSTRGASDIRSGLLPDLPQTNEFGIADQPNVPATHKEIVFHPDVQRNLVPRFLGVVGTAQSLPFDTPYQGAPWAPSNLGEVMVINTDCPINVLVTDPQGRRVGFDPQVGEIVSENPQSFVTSAGVEPQFIVIANPIPGNYQIKTTGYAAGTYGVEVAIVNASAKTQLAYNSGMTSNGQQQSFSVTYDPNAPTATATAAPSNTPTATRTGTAVTATSTRTATATATSTGGGSLYYALNGAQGGYMEAEVYTSKAGNFAAVSNAARSNGQYMHTPDGSGSDPTANYMTYNLDVTNGGSFYLSLLSNGPNTNSDSFWVSVDGGADQQVSTGAGTSWDWKKPSSTLSLPTGSHTLAIKVRDDGARVDKLYLSKSSTTPSGLGGTALSPSYRGGATPTPIATATATSAGPTATSTRTPTATRTATRTATSVGPSATPTRTATATPTTGTGSSLYYVVGSSKQGYIEAEIYTSKAGNFAAVSDATRSNGQYMHTPNGSGTSSSTNYIYYDVDITTAATYNLFLLGNGPDTGSDSFSVSVDSSADQQVATGSGTSWDWKKPSSAFTLAAATHRIYIKVREDGARVDKLYLSTSSTAPTGLGGTSLPPNYR